MQPGAKTAELLQKIAERGLALMSKPPVEYWEWYWLWEEIKTTLLRLNEFLLSLVSHPEALQALIVDYSREVQHLYQSSFVAWQLGQSTGDSNPLFSLLKKQHALTEAHLKKSLEKIHFKSPKQKKQFSFFIQQVLDCLSPEHYLFSNPELLRETQESQGQNLLQGLLNFLQDFEENPSIFRLKLTDTSAFQIGLNLATTEGQVIYRNSLMELIQYQARPGKSYQRPLLIIPPWINKYYIFDLSPENSMVRWLRDQGIQVFILSWINPEPALAKKNLSAYLEEGPLQAIEVICRQLAVEQINLMGFCIGGTLLAMLLAYLEAKGEKRVASASFFASLIDFSDPGDLGLLIDENQLERIEALMKEAGYFSGKLMAHSFNLLRAKDLIWSNFIRHYLRGKKQPAFDFLYWNNDSTNMPAKMHSQYLRWMYLQNDLVKPGKIKLKRTALCIQNIKTPSYFVACAKDHIAPWQSVYAGMQQLSGDRKFVLSSSGHIMGIINAPNTCKYHHWQNPELGISAEQWKEKAEEQQGSWWPDWLGWLSQHSGPLVTAELAPAYKALMPAPGSYVLKR